MKHCENIIITFNCDFLFFLLFLLSFLASICFFSFSFLFFSCFFSSTHVSPSPLLSSYFYFSRLFLYTACPLCFHFSFFVSRSLFLSYSHPVTHTLPTENKAKILSLLRPREEFLKRGSCVMCSKKRRRRNIKTCCVSLEMVVAKFLKTWCTPSNCVSFSFVFLFIIYLFFFRFKFKGNHEKRSDHGSWNRAVELRFKRFFTFLA